MKVIFNIPSIKFNEKIILNIIHYEDYLSNLQMNQYILINRSVIHSTKVSVWTSIYK